MRPCKLSDLADTTESDKIKFRIRNPAHSLTEQAGHQNHLKAKKNKNNKKTKIKKTNI